MASAMAVMAMDRNPLLQNNLNPVPGIGIIPGKVMLDWDLIQMRKANADDAAVAGECFPGGSKDINHDAMPGNISLGLRALRNGEVIDGEPNERGFTSASGMQFTNYDSQRSMEDDQYFQGVVATEQRVSSDDDPDHGYAIIRAGTVSVINNGPYMFYPGQYACWRLPQAPFGETDTILDPVLQRTRPGTSVTKWMPEFVPFDPTDISQHVAAAYANMKATRMDGDPGTADIQLQDFFVRNGTYASKALTPLQEEAMAYRFGDIGKVLRGVEVLVRHGYLQEGDGFIAAPNQAEEADAAQLARKLAVDIGLWSTNPANHIVQHKILASIYMASLNPGDTDRTDAMRIFKDQHLGNKTWQQASTTQLEDTDSLFGLLMSNLPEISITGITGTWYSATSKIIGKPMNSAAPADTLHLMLGHFVL